MYNEFRNSCDTYQERLKALNTLLNGIKQQIIKRDLSETLHMPITESMTNTEDLDWLDIIFIVEGSLTLANNAIPKMASYVVCPQREYHNDLGKLMYNGEPLAPENILFSERIIMDHEDDIEEIKKIFDENISMINNDIAYLESNSDIESFEYCYKKYGKNLDEQPVYNSMAEVISSFKEDN